jgi:6-pyruvoyltetrahydropterin/6-carboxytetrahydropterin synthase
MSPNECARRATYGLLMAERLLVTAATTFEAARLVSILPEGHRSRRTHGHSFTAKIRAALPPRWGAFEGDEVNALQVQLIQAIAPLDYHSLNDVMAQPTDENIARWVRNRLQVPGLEAVGIQSTAQQGADLDAADHVHVWRRYSLQSAHQLPHVPAGHKCGRMHGHGFEIIVHADQDLGGTPLGIDYDRIDALWKPIHEQLDHVCLNDVAGLENPTSEMIANWIWKRLKNELPDLSWVTVFETANCGANFDGTHYRIWKEMTLDSALYLASASSTDSRRRIHGHTYTLRLHLQAPLDTVMGWTIDFGDVKHLFAPTFARIDHRPLYELKGLEQPDCANFARWIRRSVERELPALDRIDLYQTRGCGVILSWGPADVALPV